MSHSIFKAKYEGTDLSTDVTGIGRSNTYGAYTARYADLPEVTETVRVDMQTFEGKGGFGCNPKYIVEELHRRNPNYEFVWFVNDMDKEFPDYIKMVPNTLWSRAYWLSRSKVWIDNYRKPYGTRKRKGQFYINTWHANMGFKTIGLWRGEKFSQMAYLVSANDSKMIDNVIIDSNYCEIMFRKGLVYDGAYLKVGQPRCDALFGNRDEAKAIFRERNHLPKDAKMVMFAPTFREISKDGKRGVFSEIWTIDFSRLLQNLEKRFGGEWYLCVRVHPQLASSVKDYRDSELGNRIVDCSQAADMYEILSAMDAFITDYSSAAFDAGYCQMPVFLYADDIEKYSTDRGSLLWDLTNDTNSKVYNNKVVTPEIEAILPYPIAKNNEELEQRILAFDEEVYVKALKEMEKAIGLIFDGNASSGVVDKIIKVVEEVK